MIKKKNIGIIYHMKFGLTVIGVRLMQDCIIFNANEFNKIEFYLASIIINWVKGKICG